MGTSNAIQESLESIEAEIERLTKARDALVELQGDETEEVEEVEETPRRRRRKAKTAENGDEEDKPARKSRRSSGGGKRAAERSAKADGKGDKPTKKEQIIALLEDGLSPREVADELDIATNYVYNVKREM